MAALRSSLAEVARADDTSRTVRSAEATRTLVDRLAASASNEEFLNEFAQAVATGPGPATMEQL